MSNYLDFEDEKWQKGYKPMSKSKESIKENIGKQIVYLTTRDYDSNRGYVFAKYGQIEKVKYNTMYLTNGNDVDISTILEMGVKIEQ